MGLFSAIGTVVGGAFGMPGVGSAIGGAIDASKAKSGSAASSVSGAVSSAAEDVYGKAVPYDVTGTAGTLSFDPTTRQVQSTLSPEYQAIYDRLMGRAGQYSPVIQKYTQDPIQTALGMTRDISALRAEDRDLKRKALESRLYQQGLLSSTSGVGRMSELEKGFEEADLQTLYQYALPTTMDIGKQYMAYESGDIATASKIGALPESYSGLATAGKVAPTSGMIQTLAAAPIADIKATTMAGQETTSAYEDVIGALSPYAEEYLGDAKTYLTGLFGGGSNIPKDDYNYFGY